MPEILTIMNNRNFSNYYTQIRHIFITGLLQQCVNSSLHNYVNMQLKQFHNVLISL